MLDGGVVAAVATNATHSFGKSLRSEIRLLAGLGVEGDAHLGVTVQHVARIATNPGQPNLRQVHLLHAELFDELRGIGFHVAAGELGENITTQGIDLLTLPRGSLLKIGSDAVIEVAGLRHPCQQLDDFRPGLMRTLLRSSDGRLTSIAGIMAVVRTGGRVRPSDAIQVEFPPPPHYRLERV